MVYKNESHTNPTPGENNVSDTSSVISLQRNKPVS